MVSFDKHCLLRYLLFTLETVKISEMVRLFGRQIVLCNLLAKFLSRRGEADNEHNLQAFSLHTHTYGCMHTDTDISVCSHCTYLVLRINEQEYKERNETVTNLSTSIFISTCSLRNLQVPASVLWIAFFWNGLGMF